MKQSRLIYKQEFKANHPYFFRWIYMNRCCYDKLIIHYKTHGKIGVYVCKKWRWDKNQSIISPYNLKQYKNFEKFLKKNFKDIIDKDHMVITRKNPYKPYDEKNTIVVSEKKSNTRRTIFKNSVYTYNDKRFYAIDMCAYLGRKDQSGRDLVKNINKKYIKSVKIWLESLKNSKWEYLRKRGIEFEKKIKEGLKNKEIFIISTYKKNK